jgi:hypothetical protein
MTVFEPELDTRRYLSPGTMPRPRGLEPTVIRATSRRVRASISETVFVLVLETNPRPSRVNFTPPRGALPTAISLVTLWAEGPSFRTTVICPVSVSVAVE